MFKRSIPVLLALGVLGVCSAPASAIAPAPGLTIESFATPTNFTVEGLPNSYRVRVTNAGSLATSGEIVPAARVVINRSPMLPSTISPLCAKFDRHP